MQSFSFQKDQHNQKWPSHTVLRPMFWECVIKSEIPDLRKIAKGRQLQHLYNMQSYKSSKNVK